MTCVDKNLRFYRCNVCGKIMIMLNPTDAPTICCGREMVRLEPQTIEAAKEKHIPMVSNIGRMLTVKVGSVQHPMEQNHHIEWIAIQTENGLQIAYLKPGQKPEAEFFLNDEALLNVWAYCNIHGLWEA